MATTSRDLCFLLVVLQQLLILSGDVEVNPGPLDQGKYTYYCQRYPKFHSYCCLQKLKRFCPEWMTLLLVSLSGLSLMNSGVMKLIINEFVPVIEAQRSAIFVYFQGRVESRSVEFISVTEASKSVVIVLRVSTIKRPLPMLKLYPCKLGSACNNELLEMWSSCSFNHKLTHL